MNDLMLDLETLGRKPGCGITEIGWCCFSTKEFKTSNAFGHLIPVEQSLLYGFDTDKETVRWWLEQQKGFPTLVNERARITFPQVLSDTASQLNELWFAGVTKLWSKPSLFDIPILNAAYDKLGVERPIILREDNWHNWNCSLSVKAAYRPFGIASSDTYTLVKKAHRAQEDAKDQAQVMSSIMTRMASLYQDALNYKNVIRHEIELQGQNNRQAKRIAELENKVLWHKTRGGKQSRSKSRKR